MDATVKIPCPDCDECRMCAESRCRACRKGGHDAKAPELGPAVTFGEYLAWREKKTEGKKTEGRSRKSEAACY